MSAPSTVTAFDVSLAAVRHVPLNDLGVAGARRCVGRVLRRLHEGAPLHTHSVTAFMRTFSSRFMCLAIARNSLLCCAVVFLFVSLLFFS